MSIANDRLEHAVRHELARDPRLPFPDEIAVRAYHGMVTLRGTVGSFAQNRAAVADTRRTRGVFDVYDELQVRLLDRDRREDAEIRGAALQRLMDDPALVKLTRGAAEQVARNWWVLLLTERCSSSPAS
jgi:hypothetical protein